MKVPVFLILLLSSFALGSQEVYPSIKIKTSGAITDFVLKNNSLILATDAGTIETYQLNNGKQTHFITLPESRDFMGDIIPSKVFSIDVLNEKLLVVTQGEHGFRNVLLLKGSEIDTLLFASKEKLMVKKAAFINENQLLIGLMSNELVLYNFKKKETVYTSYLSPYTFSDFSLSEDKQFVFTADESGIVHQVKVADGKITKEFSDINVDNVYKLVYRKGTIVTGGQDRRVGVYQTITGNQYYLQKDFLVYCVGLNMEGTLGAFSADEENNITVFDTFSRQEKEKLVGHESVVTTIKFIDDKTLVSASDDRYFIIWKLK